MGEGAADRTAELLELVALPVDMAARYRESFPAGRRSASALHARLRRGRS